MTSEPIKRGGRTFVSVLCDCGTEKKVDYFFLKGGRVKSCGCLRREMMSEKMKVRAKKHGFQSNPLYSIWKAMLSRCYNPKDISYKRYGAKGVVVCEEWQTDFVKFNDWCLSNGWEKGKQIDKDKIGTGKLYSPESCVIISRQENCWLRKTSRMIEYNGTTKSLAEWCNILGLKYANVRARIHNGVSPEIAFKKVA
jgi:hypothetical protein